MRLTSPVFSAGETIPLKYTCQGVDISPPLEIHDVPPQAKTLVLIVEDPDVPKHLRPDGMWNHWVVFNISPTTRHLPEGVQNIGIMGQNTDGKLQYRGPCPPDREHRYFFKLYALGASLSLAAGATKAEVLAAMEGHILASTELMGVYEKV